MTPERDPDVPALLGGAPAFPNGSAAWPPEDDGVVAALVHMAGDGSWGRYFGPHCERLVQRLQEMHECEHVVLCSSGRAAVEFALRGLAVGPGDEAALADYDFHSNFDCVRQVGAMPVLVEVREADAQLDVSQTHMSFLPGIKAVIASHLHGGVVDMPRLRDACDESGMAIIEDACQASGATISGRPAGMWGDVGVLSFGGSKLLTAGRGGALLTNRADVVQRIRRHLHGDNHASPLSEMQAAVLLPQLDRLAERHHRRAAAVADIRSALGGCEGLRLFESDAGESSPAFYKVGLLYDSTAFEELTRETFVAAIRAEGLALDVGFAALHTIHSRRRFRSAGCLSAATAAGEAVVGLHHPVLLRPDIDWRRLRLALDRIRSHALALKAAATAAATG